MILEARESAAEIEGCMEKGIDGLTRKKCVFVSKQCTCDESWLSEVSGHILGRSTHIFL